jgi:hypothetical protein
MHPSVIASRSSLHRTQDGVAKQSPCVFRFTLCLYFLGVSIMLLESFTKYVKFRPL